jgi:hypothetical protein
MMRFAQLKLARDQLVLFPERLDRAVDVARDVRLVDKTLQSVASPNGKLDASSPKGNRRFILEPWRESFGMGCCVGSGPAALEEALQVRLDFRWLAEGRGIDHSSVVVARVLWGSCSATPTESRSDSATSLNLPPISLSDSLELLDWTGRQLRRVREATQTKRCVTRVTWVTSDESSRWGLPTR